LSHPGAFWGAFLVPIFVVMIFNVVIFIWVIVVLVRHTRGTAARKKESVSNKTIIRLMISISGVMFLFGLTWLFAILTFSVTGLRETFQILFTIFNSFQGFFIFLFFCVFNKEALESWKELLSCGKYKSKLLHPSQAKFSSSAVTKKAKQSKTGSTGLTLSSGGKYVSESSRSDYESATLGKGNVYEKAPFESTKVDLGTDSTVDNSVVQDESVTETDHEQPEATTVPVVVVHQEQTESANGELQNGGAGSSGEKGEKKKKGLSLKARIKRYSTKKASKHHVEEVEVDFDSENSSQESGGEEDTTTQL
jgi:heme/copper-type cytochrome/quinol oxidase subunit 2